MNKQALYSAVDFYSPLLTDVSNKVWEYAECSMQEHLSTELYISVLKDQGFYVQENLCGIKTAFSGSFGTEKPVIGILGEYDALSGLSQEANIANKQIRSECDNGHGCGHNLLGAASLGAAIAIKKCIESGDLKGTVIFFGCPGEEGCAGKTFMARAGIFSQLDAALCWHPGDVNEVTTGTCAATLQYEYSFTGLSAHAAGDPENGRSALDAVELMNIGAQFLREHVGKKASIHYAITSTGGVSPNVVQANAKVLYMVRDETVSKAKDVLKRLHKIAEGAAMMTETTVTYQQIDGTSNTVSNAVMEHIIYGNMQNAPLPTYTEEDWNFAANIKSTYHSNRLPGQKTENIPELKKLVTELSKSGSKALNDFLIPYTPSNDYEPGSTDVGDVSWLTPTAQFTAVTWPSGSPGHSWQIVSVGKHPVAVKGMLYAAKVLAGSAADIMESKDLLAKIKEEFSEIEGNYDCPLEEDLPIP